MNFKKLSCWLFITCWICFYANAEITNKNNITVVKVYSIAPGTNDETLILKITVNSIIKYIDKKCANEEIVTSCLADSEELQYLGEHDIFNFIPVSFLSNSSYAKLSEYEKYKIETCFSDGHCNTWIWHSQHITDKDIKIFLNKITAILLDESEYQFQPKSKITVTAPHKKNLTDIYIYRPNRFIRSLVLKISTNSITKYFDPDIHFESEKFPWYTYRVKEQYIGQHNLLDVIPLQLTTSFFCDPGGILCGSSNNDGWIIESCYSDGSCNCWHSIEILDDKEGREFLGKMVEILDNKSEYNFQPIYSFTTNTIIKNKKDVTRINIYNLIPYPFVETLILEITPDSIKKHMDLNCEQTNGWHCFKDGAETQYRGHHNLFDLIPTLFLSNSYFLDPRKFGHAGYKVEICFTDGHCNLWSDNIPNIEDDNKYKEIQTFLDEIRMIKSDKSKYKFQRINNK